MVALRIGALGALLAAPLAAFASEPAVPPSLGFGSILQVVLGLGLVLGMVAGTAWLVRRLGVAPGASAGSLRLRGSVAVGHRERVMIVEIENTWLVVGVAPGRVTPLHRLPRPVAPGGQATLAAATTPRFTDWLKKTIERRDA